MMSRYYKVIWEMGIEASSPKDAAEKALNIHRDDNSLATYFYVDDGTDITAIDLGTGEVEIVPKNNIGRNQNG